jgi:hypothetical protein
LVHWHSISSKEVCVCRSQPSSSCGKTRCSAGKKNCLSAHCYGQPVMTIGLWHCSCSSTPSVASITKSPRASPCLRRILNHDVVHRPETLHINWECLSGRGLLYPKWRLQSASLPQVMQQARQLILTIFLGLPLPNGWID